MNSNAQALVRYAARWPISITLVVCVLMLILPIWIAVALMSAYLITRFYMEWKIQKEVAATIEAIESFTTLEQAMDIINTARRERNGEKLSRSLAKVVGARLAEGSGAQNCFQGHKLGCKHRRVQEKEGWPEALKEEIRKAQVTVG